MIVKDLKKHIEHLPDDMLIMIKGSNNSPNYKQLSDVSHDGVYYLILIPNNIEKQHNSDKTTEIN
jgi:hypothetical protein